MSISKKIEGISKRSVWGLDETDDFVKKLRNRGFSVSQDIKGGEDYLVITIRGIF